MFRGDNSLGLGRPKFLSDQMFSGPLFGSTYAEPGNMHEGGPEVGAGIELGREHYGYSAMATDPLDPARRSEASQRGVIMNKIYWFVMRRCNETYARTPDEINTIFQNTLGAEILADQNGALRQLLGDTRAIDTEFIWKNVQTVIKNVRDAIKVHAPEIANGAFYCYVLREALRQLCPTPGAWVDNGIITTTFAAITYNYIGAIRQIIFQGLQTFGMNWADEVACRTIYEAPADGLRPLTIKNATLLITHNEAIAPFNHGAGSIIQFYNTLRLMLYGDTQAPTSTKIVKLMMLGWNVGRVDDATDLATTFDNLDDIRAGGSAQNHDININALFTPPAVGLVQSIHGGIDTTGATDPEYMAALIYWLAAAIQAIAVRANATTAPAAAVVGVAAAGQMPALCALPRASLVGAAQAADVANEVVDVLALGVALTNARVALTLGAANWDTEVHQVLAYRALHTMCHYMRLAGLGADATVSNAVDVVDARIGNIRIRGIYNVGAASIVDDATTATSMAAMVNATNDELNNIYNTITARASAAAPDSANAEAAMVIGDLYWQKFCAKLSIARTMESVWAGTPPRIQADLTTFINRFVPHIMRDIDRAANLVEVVAQIDAASWQERPRLARFFRQMLAEVTMPEVEPKFASGRAIFDGLLDFAAPPNDAIVRGLIRANTPTAALVDKFDSRTLLANTDRGGRAYAFALIAADLYIGDLFGHWHSQLSDVPAAISYPPQFDSLQVIEDPRALSTVIDVTGLRQDLPAVYMQHQPNAMVTLIPANVEIPEGSIPHYDPLTGLRDGYTAVSSLDADNIDQYYYYTPNNSGSMPKLYALFYLGQTADKTPTVKVVPLGSHPYEKKRILEAVGRMRFDTTFMRKIFFITNLFRLTRLNISRIASEFHKVIIKSHALTNPSITEYGAYPYGPNEIYENRRFDIDTEFVPI